VKTSRRVFLGAGFVTGMGMPTTRTSAQTLQTAQLGGKIAYVRNGSIWQWSNGNAEEILSAENISDARWSPDGASLIYVRSDNSYSDLYTYSTTTGVETQLTDNQPPYDIGSIEYAQNASWVLDPDWSTSGLIGFISDAIPSGGLLALFLMSSVADVPYLALSPEAEDDIFDLMLSADGALAIYTARARTGDGSSSTYVAVRDLNNGIAYSIAESKGDQFDPAISPDNSWFALTIRDQSEVTDLWIVERDTGERSRLTRGQNALAPRWSADGRFLSWIRMEAYQFEIWVASFIDGKISNNTKLVDDSGIDPMSGLSWWVDTGADISAE
jgi:Tol biopolymer transport system component